MSPTPPAPAAPPAPPPTDEGRCRGGDEDACLRLARRCRTDRGYLEEPCRALQRRACAQGDAGGCSYLADRCRYDQDDGVDKASAECAERQRIACEAGDDAYCRKLAGRHADPQGRLGVAYDEARATQLLERACAGTNPDMSCLAVARRYEEGLGTAIDPARAVWALERDCDEDEGIYPQACNRLAHHLAAGDGVARDEVRAAKLFGKVCGEGNCDVEALRKLCAVTHPPASTLAGCASLVGAHLTAVAYAPYDPQEAIRIATRACARGDGRSCHMVAGWYLEGARWHGPGGSTDIVLAASPTRAAAFRRKACTLGVLGACP